MKKNFKAHIALIVAGLLFGANYWIAKGLMPDYMQPFQIVFARILGATVLFWVFDRIMGSEKVEFKDLAKIALCSLLGVAINQIMFFKGLFYTNPVDTAVIHITSPILVLLFASLLIKEKISMKRIFGIILGFLGAFLITSKGNEISFNSDTFKGNVFIMINVTSYSLYLVVIKPLMQKYKLLTIMKWVFAFGLIFITPFTVVPFLETDWGLFNYSAWSSLGYVVIFTTFLTYFLTIFGLKKLSASQVGFYIYLQPLVAAFIGIIIFDKSLDLTSIIASLLIFAGVYLVSTQSQKMTEGK